MRIGWFSALTMAALGACSLVTDLDALQGAPDDAGIAADGPSSTTSSSSGSSSSSSSSGATDAATPGEAGVDAGPVCPLPSVLVNGGFEDNLVSWSADGMPRIVSTAHAGTRSLELCGATESSYAAAVQEITTAETSLRVRVWMRAAPGLVPVNGTYIGGGRVDAGATGQNFPLTLTDQWQCLEAGLEPGEFTRLLLTVYKTVGAEGCVLLDDVEAFATDGSPLDEACKCPVAE